MKKKRFLIVIFIAGFLILTYPHLARFINNKILEKQSQDFKTSEISTEEINKIREKAQKYNEDLLNNLDTVVDPFSDTNQNYEHKQEFKDLFDNQIFAVLELPKLNYSIPIYLGASQEILSQGIGQVEGSSLPIGGINTHTVLSGHRGMGTKAMFRNVDQLKEGDEFYIHLSDETITYKVYGQKVVQANETSNLEIEYGKDLATLYTCHPYRLNYERLLIQAERVE